MNYTYCNHRDRIVTPVTNSCLKALQALVHENDGNKTSQLQGLQSGGQEYPCGAVSAPTGPQYVIHDMV